RCTTGDTSVAVRVADPPVILRQPQLFTADPGRTLPRKLGLDAVRRDPRSRITRVVETAFDLDHDGAFSAQLAQDYIGTAVPLDGLVHPQFHNVPQERQGVEEVALARRVAA